MNTSTTNADCSTLDDDAQADKSANPSTRSVIGLNVTNFFLAEITGVVMPFMASYLQGKKWSESNIGIAIAAAGLGVFLFQTPAGAATDRIPQRRTMLAIASIVLGICYGLIPIVPAHPILIDSLLFGSGVAQAFFTPLLAALALGLVGHAGLNRMIAVNQGWNHLGNIVSAVLAIVLIQVWGVASVFLAVPVVSVLAAMGVYLIRESEIDEKRANGSQGDSGKATSLITLFKDRRVVILLVTTALFHLANAPVMPFVGAYITHLGGSEMQVAAVVLVAQAVMVPVAVVSGGLCDRWGRKPLFTIALIALPLRIFLYSLTSNPWILVALQALDGIGAGIYGVVIVAICADLTKGKGGFNTLGGVIATALAIGGVVGPVMAGFLAQKLGYNGFFYVFTGIASVAAFVFLVWMPETQEVTVQDSTVPSKDKKTSLAGVTA